MGSTPLRPTSVPSSSGGGEGIEGGGGVGGTDGGGTDGWDWDVVPFFAPGAGGGIEAGGIAGGGGGNEGGTMGAGGGMRISSSASSSATGVTVGASVFSVVAPEAPCPASSASSSSNGGSSSPNPPGVGVRPSLMAFKISVAFHLAYTIRFRSSPPSSVPNWSKICKNVAAA